MQFSSTMCSNKIEYEETRIAIRRFLPTRYTFGFVALDSAMINAIICNPHLPHYTYDNAVIGEMSFRNEYDGHTIDRMLDPTPRMFDTVPLVWICNPDPLSIRIFNPPGSNVLPKFQLQVQH